MSGVRLWIVPLAALLLVGCASESGVADSPKPSAPQLSERCTQRMVGSLKDRRPTVRRYIQRTYCDRFAANGWVYADGKLRIQAHLWVVNGATCSTSRSGGPTVTRTPCPIDHGDLECAVLHFVRKPEAQAYIRRLERTGEVKCDDGTPLRDLGA